MWHEFKHENVPKCTIFYELGHCKMSFYYPSFHGYSREALYFLLCYSMICVIASPL